VSRWYWHRHTCYTVCDVFSSHGTDPSWDDQWSWHRVWTPWGLVIIHSYVRPLPPAKDLAAVTFPFRGCDALVAVDTRDGHVTGLAHDSSPAAASLNHGRSFVFLYTAMPCLSTHVLLLLSDCHRVGRGALGLEADGPCLVAKQHLHMSVLKNSLLLNKVQKLLNSQTHGT
jgi:hypothetical protein